MRNSYPLTAFCNYLQEQGKSHHTVRLYAQAVRSCLKMIAKPKIGVSQDALDIYLSKLTTSQRTFFVPAWGYFVDFGEVNGEKIPTPTTEVLSRAKTTFSVSLAGPLLESGLNPTQLFRYRWSHLSFTETGATLPGRARHSAPIPLSPDAIDALEQIKSWWLTGGVAFSPNMPLIPTAPGSFIAVTDMTIRRFAMRQGIEIRYQTPAPRAGSLLQEARAGGVLQPEDELPEAEAKLVAEAPPPRRLARDLVHLPDVQRQHPDWPLEKQKEEAVYRYYGWTREGDFKVELNPPATEAADGSP